MDQHRTILISAAATDRPVSNASLQRLLVASFSSLLHSPDICTSVHVSRFLAPTSLSLHAGCHWSVSAGSMGGGGGGLASALNVATKRGSRDSWGDTRQVQSTLQLIRHITHPA